MLCSGPIFIEAAGGVVPCGQCSPCRFNLRRKRTARLLLEAKCHEHILFVTFTYSDEHLPTVLYCPKTGEIQHEHPSGCVDYRTVQLMLKRLRRRLPPQSLRYYGVVEYGPKTMRPHAHFLFFGLPWKKRHFLYDVWADPHTGDPYCDPNRLDIQVPKSESHVAQYVSGYLVKKMTRKDDVRLQGRPPERAFFSKGIGSPYLERLLFGFSSRSAMAYIYSTGDIPRQFSVNGKQWPIDRYLKEKIIHALGIQDQIHATTRAQYAEEMRLLQERAKANPLLPQSWKESSDPKYMTWLLEKQFVLERQQDLLNFDRKTALFDRRQNSC